ncbi:kinase-like domain-containing protein [Whalleya microplaca]|nr:kinase-like domain-containing protein [Whalleya microplaca]
MASRIGTGQFMAPEVCRNATYGPEVDIWSLGIVMLFLLVPQYAGRISPILEVSPISRGSTNSALCTYSWDPLCPDLKCMSQIEINKWLNDVFGGSSSKTICKDGQNFIQSCLVLDPAGRMTTLEAKRHSWFQQQPEKASFQELFKENDKVWKTAHLIAPPVEELPDMGYDDHIPNDTTQSAPFKAGKFKRVLTDSQPSPYFARSDSAAPKRLKTSREIPPQTIPNINIIPSTPDQDRMISRSSSHRPSHH